MTDDRVQFERERREAAARMAGDTKLAKAALDVNVAADEHDWSYQWSWLGLPVIQLPTDIVALQEVIWETRPQLVIETGIARGGSLVLYASILELLGEGLVLGIDIDIRAHNREAIEAHPLAHRIKMVEGSSLAESVLGEAGRAAGGSRAGDGCARLGSHPRPCPRRASGLRTLRDDRAVPRGGRHVCREHSRAGAPPGGPGGRATTRARRCRLGSRRSRASSPIRS